MLERTREREARLAERVETLERLQETARRTVLDREERLRKAEAAAAAAAAVVTEAVTTDHGDGMVSSSANTMRPVANDTGIFSSVAADLCATGRATTAAASTAVVADDNDDDGEGTTARRGVGSASTGGDRVLTERDEEHFSAQEWWLHLAVAEKKREEREHESQEASKTASSGGGGEAVVSGSGGGNGKEVRRLHRLLEEQGLEVVALRQRVLKAEIIAREKGKVIDSEHRAMKDLKKNGTIGAEAAASAGLEGSSMRTHSSASLAEMEGRIAALHAQGDVREALLVAREAVSAMKLACLRSKGEVELHAQLLVRCDYLGSIAAHIVVHWRPSLLFFCLLQHTRCLCRLLYCSLSLLAPPTFHAL